MRLVCGCLADKSSVPTVLSVVWGESAIRRRLVHACGKSWRQIEIREDGEKPDEADS